MLVFFDRLIVCRSSSVDFVSNILFELIQHIVVQTATNFDWYFMEIFSFQLVFCLCFSHCVSYANPTLLNRNIWTTKLINVFILRGLCRSFVYILRFDNGLNLNEFELLLPNCTDILL